MRIDSGWNLSTLCLKMRRFQFLFFVPGFDCLYWSATCLSYLKSTGMIITPMHTDSIWTETVAICFTIEIILARKRSLGQGIVFTPVCYSIHRGCVYTSMYHWSHDPPPHTCTHACPHACTFPHAHVSTPTPKHAPPPPPPSYWNAHVN